MGQKVNPIGFRVAVNKNWRSRWYAERRQYGDFFHEDLKIRALIMKRLAGAAVPEVIIERYANRVRATIFTARPGIVIGHKDGKPHHLSGIARDVSERKQAEAELQLRNAELRANNDELERFNRLTIDREGKMIELKQEINALLTQAGGASKYRIVE